MSIKHAYTLKKYKAYQTSGGKLSIAENDIVFENAYLAIGHIVDDAAQAIAQVNVYADIDKTVIIDGFSLPFSVNSNESLTEQAYKHLKTLPEFAGATDC